MSKTESGRGSSGVEPTDDAVTPGRPGRRWRILTFGVAVLLALGLAAALLYSNTRSSRPPEDLVDSLNLLKKSNCGNELVRFKREPTHDAIWVFPLDGSWHHTRPCLDNLRESARNQQASAPIHDFIYNQVLFVLSQKPVKFYRVADDTEAKSLGEVIRPDRSIDFDAFDRIVYVNNRGVAHNSMSHVDLMILLFRMAELYLEEPHPQPDRAAVYEDLGAAVINVVMDPVNRRGLRTRSDCDLYEGYSCSLFHAVTNRNRVSSDVGGTLNKNLQVIRDLNRGAMVLKRMQTIADSPPRAAQITAMHDAVGEGINQLVYSSGLAGPNHTPSLFDYLPRNAAGVPIEKAWLYYAINVPKAKGYYLRREYWKNCSYHILDMVHLHFILQEAGHLTDTSGFREPVPMLGDRSILHFILDTYLDKLEGPDGLYKDTPTEPDGEYMGCKEGFKPPAPQFVVDFLRDY